MRFSASSTLSIQGIPVPAAPYAPNNSVSRGSAPWWGSTPTRSAFAVSRDPDGLIFPGPCGVFQPLTSVKFESPFPRDAGGGIPCSRLPYPVPLTEVCGPFRIPFAGTSLLGPPGRLRVRSCVARPCQQADTTRWVFPARGLPLLPGSTIQQRVTAAVSRSHRERTLAGPFAPPVLVRLAASWLVASADSSGCYPASVPRGPAEAFFRIPSTGWRLPAGSRTLFNL